MFKGWLQKVMPRSLKSQTTKKSIIVSGNNNYGLAQEIQKAFPYADFCSRSTSGHDFNRHEDRIHFAEKSLQYDVYVSCSCLSQFRQVLLLQQVYEAWVNSNKSGHIICIGSSRDNQVGGTDWTYPIEKRALRDYCTNLSLKTTRTGRSGDPVIKVTYIRPGYFSTPKVDAKYPEAKKMTPAYMASLIQWIMSQPSEYNISELNVSPLQTTLSN